MSFAPDTSDIVFDPPLLESASTALTDDSPLYDAWNMPFSPLQHTPESDAPSLAVDHSAFEWPLSPLPMTDAAASVSQTLMFDVRDVSAQTRVVPDERRIHSKRTRHRQLDASRRRREKAAVERLRHMFDLIDGKSHSQTDRAMLIELAAETIAKLNNKLQQQTLSSPPPPPPSLPLSSSPPRLVEHIAMDVVSAQSDSLIGMLNRELRNRTMRAETFFLDLFMKSPDMQLIFDADTGIILYVNDAFVSGTGYDRATMLTSKSYLPRSAFLQEELPTSLFSKTAHSPATPAMSSSLSNEETACDKATKFSTVSTVAPYCNRKAMQQIAALYRNEVAELDITMIVPDGRGHLIESDLRVRLSKMPRTHPHKPQTNHVATADSNTDDDMMTVVHNIVKARRYVNIDVK